jgi:hypothetical protein
MSRIIDADELLAKLDAFRLRAKEWEKHGYVSGTVSDCMKYVQSAKTVPTIKAILMSDNILHITVLRKNDNVDVLLVPHKDGSGWSYVNLTKGHICPCVFKTKEEAIADLDKQDDVENYYWVEKWEDRNALQRSLY